MGGSHVENVQRKRIHGDRDIRGWCQILKNVHIKESYTYLTLSLRSALDRSANFLTILAERTVKNFPRLIGPGFESRSWGQKGYPSIISI